MSDAPVSFKNAAAFRAWLTRHHSSSDALVVSLSKVRTGRGLTYAQALDEALCFGWIDGVRRSLDADSYSVRFTPRRPRSIWSRVNIAHVERLTSEGRMTPAGVSAFEARDERRTGTYSFERPPAELPSAFVRTFRANNAAWMFFQAQAPWYRRTTIHWVVSAKRQETRTKRLATLIACCAQQKRIGLLGGPVAEPRRSVRHISNRRKPT